MHHSWIKLGHDHSSENVNIKIYKTVILPGEPWSLTSKEEHMLKVFEREVLTRIFVSNCKRWEVAGGWRKLP
jgi:hypothetical protein